MKSVRLYGYWALFLIIAVIGIELFLRSRGNEPGIISMKFPTRIYWYTYLYADEKGINRYRYARGLPDDYVLNADGFRSSYDYTPESVEALRKRVNRPLIMLVGDSFVEGCCVRPVSLSFPDLLAATGKYIILNFGIGGTDPLQYELIVREYLPKLKPDLVVVVTLDNDILYYERKPSPGIPNYYPIEGLGHVPAAAPILLGNPPNTLFADYREAVGYLEDVHTLPGHEPSFLDHLCSKTVIGTRLWGGGKVFFKKMIAYMQLPDEPLSGIHLQNIYTICQERDIPSLFTGIPEPGDLKKDTHPKEKWDEFFQYVPYYFPIDLQDTDWKPLSEGGHFNKEGNRKYARFLEGKIDHVLAFEEQGINTRYN